MRVKPMRNGKPLKVVSLFSGCGGLDLGFKWAGGFDIIWANDIHKDLCETYRNNVDKHIVEGDISDISSGEIPEADVVIGGPPCQSFSMIGKRNPNDTRGVLIWEFARVVEELKPSIFLMENVTGLKSAKTSDGQRVIDEVLKTFKDMGYSLDVNVLNAADFGVPQLRKRLFILGSIRGNLKLPTPPEKPWCTTVEEAIGDLPLPSNDKIGTVPYRKSKRLSEYQKWARENVKPGELVYNHWKPQMSELDKKIIEHVPPGGNYRDVPDYIPSERIRKYKETGGRTTTYGRMRPDRPSYTLNTYFSRPNVGCNIHYKEDRLITIREGLRLQSFRDDFRIPHRHPKRSQYFQVGNAVPPLLAEAIAKSIKDQVKKVGAWTFD